jgi:hypothetical protein
VGVAQADFFLIAELLAIVLPGGDINDPLEKTAFYRAL